MNEFLNCKDGLEPYCGRLCSHDNITHLMTRIALVEGNVLERLENEKIIILRELIKDLDWEPCAISMAVGSLMRQGMIECTEYNQDVFIELGKQSAK